MLQLPPRTSPTPRLAGHMVAEWHAAPDTECDVHVCYALALESIPMLQGGPPTAVRVDGRAFSGIGEVLFAQPNLETPVAIKVDWHLEGMPKGAQAVTRFGDGDIDQIGSASRRERGGPYVSISVVDCDLKKKKEQQEEYII